MLKRTGTLFLAVVLSAGALTAAAAEKTPTAVGVVADYSASDRTFSIRDDQGKTWKFVWNHDTKFNGVVSAGARVSVRYSPHPDGVNVAQTVGILK
jgi:hypothetical protein